MKPIRKLNETPSGLAGYIAEEEGEATWPGFRSHRAGESYKELIEFLTCWQHRLCSYCEISIAEGRRQVEHVRPRRGARHERGESLDIGNMVACCLGGTLSTDADPERYKAPARSNLSCGQKKGGDTLRGFIDPRTLPPSPALMRVGSDGRVSADEDACAAAGRPVADVAATIGFLGLNVERLRVARARRWRALQDAWARHYEDESAMREAARGELLPHAGELPPFFTTNRSFFAEWGGEEILRESPRDWI